MEKLKKLVLNKKYINITSKSCFLEYFKNHKIDCKIKKLSDEEVIFYSNEIIRDEQIKSMNRINFHYKHTFLKHFSLIISIILCLIILLSSGDLIRNIEFENVDEYNQEVYEEVLRNVDKKGPFYILKGSINEISHNLQTKFPEYAFIGITKHFSKIIINLQKHDTPIVDNETSKITGDIVSMYDAVISDIVVSKGVVCVIKNQSVKKGDLLISGNLNIENASNDPSKLVKSTGIIIGKTIVLEKIKVPIKEETLEYSGRVKVRKRVKIFNNYLGKNSLPFNDYYTKEETLFNMFNILIIEEISHYEKVIVEKVHNLESALSYAKSIVKRNFEVNRVSNLESIDNIKLLDVSIEQDYYLVSLIIEKHVNIGVFHQH
ncbi:MAG: sporulation protein YqfD [Bacilli bacterium]|nr:sporulation protein YqfD [Bacilli bacterium]